jgi:hypothetical protein
MVLDVDASNFDSLAREPSVPSRRFSLFGGHG